MPKHDKPILDVSAIRINRDHFRHWKTHFHDYCLLEGYRNPTKDRLTQTTDHYIEAKRPFELAVLRSAIPSLEWNTLDNVIASDHRPKKPIIWCHSHWDLMFMQNLDHFNGEALGFMVKLSTVQPSARTASTRAISCSTATGPSCVQPEHAPKQPLPLPLMQPSVPATPGHKPAQPLPAAPLQIERTVTPPPTQPQQQEQQISETPVVHVNQQTTRSGRVARLPQKYKDFVLS